jgi:DNA-binding transcriptional regulator YhcF (GntR family)
MPIQFQLDSTTGVPFYRQIIDQLLTGVATGSLAPGDRLPTVRALAVELAVNPNTVARAYKELEIRGLVTTQQGSGTFVSHAEVRRDEVARRGRLVRLIDDFLARGAADGFRLDEIRAALDERRES